MTTSHLLILDAAETSSLQLAISKQQGWFQHYGSSHALQDIRMHGLKPALQSPAMWSSDYYEEAKRYGTKLLCLSIDPRRSPIQLTTETVLLVVEATHLPNRLGFDWSFQNAIDVARRAVARCSTPDQAFVEAVMCAEVLVSYETIPASALRVKRPGDDRKKQRTWPMLCDTDDAEIERFAADTQVY